MWHTESNSPTQVKPISFETRDRGAYIGDTQNCSTPGLFAVAWPHALQTQRQQARRLPQPSPLSWLECHFIKNATLDR
jgi:hypothetical protein